MDCVEKSGLEKSAGFNPASLEPKELALPVSSSCLTRCSSHLRAERRYVYAEIEFVIAAKTVEGSTSAVVVGKRAQYTASETARNTPRLVAVLPFDASYCRSATAARTPTHQMRCDVAVCSNSADHEIILNA